MTDRDKFKSAAQKSKCITGFVSKQLKSEALLLRQIITAKIIEYFSKPDVPDKTEALVDQVQLLAIPEVESRLNQTLRWMSCINSSERMLVWRRAENAPWKTICKEFGVCRSKAFNTWKTAIEKISSHLNHGHF